MCTLYHFFANKYVLISKLERHDAATGLTEIEPAAPHASTEIAGCVGQIHRPQNANVARGPLPALHLAGHLVHPQRRAPPQPVPKYAS